MASDGAAEDIFGHSVDISNDHIVVGAVHNDDLGSLSGSAYRFYRDNNGTRTDLSDDFWVEDEKILASDGVAYDYFGSQVATSGSILLIGAYGDDDQGDVSGSAYVFSTKLPMPCFAVNKMIAKDKITYGSERDKIKVMGSLDLDVGPGSDPFDPPPAVTVTITYGDPTETIAVTFPEESFEETDVPGTYVSRIDIAVGRAIMKVNLSECFWKVVIKGEDASGIYDSGQTPTIEVDFGGSVGTDTFENWTKKKVRDGKRIAKFKADPKVNCCEENVCQLTVTGAATPVLMDPPGQESISYINRDATYMLVNVWPWPSYLAGRDWNPDTSSWGAPTQIRPPESGYGTISPDGNILVWAGRDVDPSGAFAMAERTPGGEWGPAELIDVDGLPLYKYGAHFTGGQLYFTEERPGAPTNAYDNWVMDFDEDTRQFLNPRLLGEPVNSEWEDHTPWVSEDGQLMIFASDRPDGHGARDLWSATWDTQLAQWTNVTNLGPEINTELVETLPRLAVDAGLLFFQRYTPGQTGNIMQIPVTVTCNGGL